MSEHENIKNLNNGVKFYKEKDYQRAVEIWNKIPENSKYYEKAKLYMERAKYNIRQKDNEENKEEKNN